MFLRVIQPLFRMPIRLPISAVFLCPFGGRRGLIRAPIQCFSNATPPGRPPTPARGGRAAPPRRAPPPPRARGGRSPLAAKVLPDTPNVAQWIFVRRPNHGGGSDSGP